ncbi:MAG: hypothetical protein AABX28_00440 [Nanoarchaeota archaeon]
MPKRSDDPEEKAYMRDVYERSGKSLSRAARISQLEGRGFSIPTLRKLLRAEGAYTPQRQRYPLGFDEKYFRQVFDERGGDITRMEGYNDGISPSLKIIYLRCLTLNLTPVNVPKELLNKINGKVRGEHNDFAVDPSTITAGSRHHY